MGIWNRIFQRDDASDIVLSNFGRFSDAYKPLERYGHWDKAVKAFEKGEYKTALIHFFSYLQNDEADNAFVNQQARYLDFYLIQGSKKICGQCEDDRLIVTAKLVSGMANSTGLLRRLLEKNYALNYCRFALDDQDQIIAIFDTFIQDANPYKLYFGLKELAIQADKMDDLILSEHEDLRPQDASHTRPISNDIVKLKTNFYYSKIQWLKHELEEGYLKKARDPNVIIYSILSIFYKLDYLLTPHGQSTEVIERAHKAYFADAARPVELRVSSLMNAVDELSAIAPEELQKEWYEVIYTFGINPPIDLYQAQSAIQTEIKKIDWYLENNEFDQARAVTGFIIGYILFDYALDHLLKALLTMYYRVTDEAYFQALGVSSSFVKRNGELSKKNILSEMKDIINQYEDEFHAIDIPIDQLNFRNIYYFGYSLLLMILNSSFTPLEMRK